MTESNKKLAVVRVRSGVNASPDVRRTFQLLNLPSKNACVLVNDTPSTRGMLFAIKDFCTWGFVDEEVVKIVQERMKKRKYACLAPPVKGYGRKGIKTPFSKGGALGDRKEAMSDLIKRMLPVQS